MATMNSLSISSVSALRRRLAPLLAIVCLTAPALHAYPLDGESESGIRRLEGYALQQQRSSGPKLASGALLGGSDIELGLIGRDVADFDTRSQDPALADMLAGIFQGRDPSYALVVVDISDPENVRWAGLRPDTRQ
ncbi:MAG: hypothetical protein OEQ25_10175, partial [Gammaproteobacteria bacterium]|nr:hypothetical protein [Gammaproteobacteria bacterium]